MDLIYTLAVLTRALGRENVSKLRNPIRFRIVPFFYEWFTGLVDTQITKVIGIAPIPSTCMYLVWNAVGAAATIHGISGQVRNFMLEFHPKHSLVWRARVAISHTNVPTLYLYTTMHHNTFVQHRVQIFPDGTPRICRVRGGLSPSAMYNLHIAQDFPTNTGYLKRCWQLWRKTPNGRKETCYVPDQQVFMIAIKKRSLGVVSTKNKVYLNDWNQYIHSDKSVKANRVT
jgi:hypothetical protein